jgi:hypothetical protein
MADLRSSADGSAVAERTILQQLVYDLHTGQLRPVAKLATDRSGQGALSGGWESSGVVDASGPYGRDWWLLDVQDHTGRVS